MRLFRRASAVVGLISAASCSTGATSTTPAVTPVSVATVAKLQFGVGTATIAYPGGAFTGTNFVSTFRSSDGHSATLVNTPTITGPPGFVIGISGAANIVSGILPNVFNQAVLTASSSAGGSLPASFGASLGPLVGVFGYGMAGDNLLSSQVSLQLETLTRQGGVCQDLNSGLYTGSASYQTSPSISVPGIINGLQTGGTAPATSVAQSNELGLPLGYGQGINQTRSSSCPQSTYATTPATPTNPTGGSTIFPINYYGGPPAWPSAQGYGEPAYFVGYPVGFTDVATPPVAGPYSLDVAYPTNQAETTYGHFDATATLRNTTPLPALTIASASATSGGTGTVTLTVPAGLFETIVFVRSQDCDPTERPNFAFDNYAVVTHSTGTQSFVFSANLGPPNNAGQPVPTFCPSVGGAGINATAYAVGFDYPAYESSYPFNVSQTPTIVNSNGQADVTTSAPLSFSGM